ncbi:MAG: helix-turn-helix domain-containing protein [Arcicella sp.]|jgi:AraC-like DNA-binding protein|nr:helix-turn-helix domain-containing protein [Arcicella sp.]
MELAIIVGIIITFFLSFILFTKKGKNLADKILATWLVFVGIHLWLFYEHILVHNYQYPALLGVELPMPFLQWPFLYIYIKVLTNQYNPAKKWLLLLHFLPVISIYIYLIDFFILSPAEKVFVFEHGGNVPKYASFTVTMLVLMSISGLLYFLITYRLIKQHRRNIVNQFSYQEKINLDWLQYLFVGMGLIWVVIWLRGNDNLIFLSVVIFVIFLGYFGIKQVGIFTNRFPTEKELEETEIEIEKIKKYEKSSLTESAAVLIHTQLKTIMESERLYENPELSLNDLAVYLNVHPNSLSQVINTFEGKTFFDYINYHRVEAFKTMVKLPQNQKYTLLALAYDCGFNSKTSFNRNFKKATGFAPSEYLKQLNIVLD